MKNLLNELRVSAKNKELTLLTLEDVESLKGKRIQTIYFGYNGQDGVDDFVVGDVLSEYEIAQKDTDIDGFENRAKYWESYMSKSQLADQKAKLQILTADGRKTYIRCESNHESVFWCSDSDRFVQYRVVEDEN